MLGAIEAPRWGSLGCWMPRLKPWPAYRPQKQGQKQIPRGNDRKKGNDNDNRNYNGNGNSNSNGKEQGQKQIPRGNDSKKSKGKDQGADKDARGHRGPSSGSRSGAGCQG